MKIEASANRKMKYQALCWLRLDQRCMFIATEAGANNADVIGVNEKKTIEVEIKVSIEDLKADFRKHKHLVYGDQFGMGGHNQWIPTHFYFMLPEALIEDAKAFLATRLEQFPRSKDYGLISAESFTVVKRAGWLHKNPPTNRVKCTIALRMGSELLRFQEAWL